MAYQKKRQIAILNGLGTVGYVASATQWSWALIILVPLLVESPMFRFFVPTDSVAPPLIEHNLPVVQTYSVSPVMIVLAILVGVAVMIAGLYIMAVKVPRLLVKTGEKVTHTPALVLTPVITRHMKLPAKQKKMLSTTIIVAIKLLLVFIPLGLLFLSNNMNIAISFELIMLIGITLFSWSILFFALQFVLCRVLDVDYRSIR